MSRAKMWLEINEINATTGYKKKQKKKTAKSLHL